MSNFQIIEQGTITSSRGFVAGAEYAGIKTRGNDILDLGIILSETPCKAAGMFTTNKIKAAPVILSQQHIKKKQARAIVINSGCANACTGKQGIADAEEMIKITAKKLDLLPEEILIASTGVIGVPLPIERIRSGIENIHMSKKNGYKVTRAIMTTDTFPKEIALKVKFNDEQREVIISGIAKGSGMIHPNLATMLCFLTTDAAIDPNFLKSTLNEAVNKSFNMITVDGDTSPNDSVLILANGLAGNSMLANKHPNARNFKKALEDVCVYLAKQIARDGEGATKLIEVHVERAITIDQARIGARTIASSSLVKSAIHGCDPNWGRIVAAIGRSGSELDESKIDLCIQNICLMKSGHIQSFSKEHVKTLLNAPEIQIQVSLNLGEYSATAWGCDLSEEYIRINSEYTT